MSMLANITKGRIKAPEFVVLYGPDGIGKSTFGASAPKPVFLGAESGTDNLDVSRLPTPKSFEDCRQAVRELREAKHDFETLVVDTLDWIEPLIFSEMTGPGGGPIEDSCGGYGKWQGVYADKWRDYMKQLTDLREARKMNIILLAHAQVKGFNDPKTNSTYDRYLLKLHHEKASAVIREAVHNVLFANFETFTKEEKNSKKAKAFGDGSRKLYTERRPAFDAKNRDSLPSELNFSWDDYMAAKLSAQAPSAKAVAGQILELSNQLAPDVQKKIAESVAKAGDNVGSLNVIMNRVRTILGAA